MVNTASHAMEDGDVPFAERGVSDLRAEFVALAQQPGANRRALCRRFGIAPTTGYKWLQRYAAEGPAGLADRSRRPRRSPTRTAPALEQAVLALRAQHPTWGARKLRVLLTRQGVQPLPAVSTITAILRRHGALDPAQGAGQPRAFQRFEHPHPNALWQMDFKAGWPCGPGRCHPLTILDDHSRYALGLAACPNQRTATVRAHLVTAFQRYGLPDRLLVDNGSPWGPGRPIPIRRSPSGCVAWASPSATAGPTTPRRWARTSASTAPGSVTWGGSRPGPTSAPGRPPSMPGGTSTTMSGPTRVWPWRCRPAAITSAPAPIPPSCRRCPTGPRTRSVASRRAAGCRFRAGTSGCPRRCGGSPWRFARPPSMAAGPSAS